MIAKRLDRSAIVTGASRGLGALVAAALARRGVAVALLARDRERLEGVAAQIRATGGIAEPFPVDLADFGAATRAAEAALARLGRIDALFNIAGAKLEGPAEQAKLADAQNALAVNYLAPLALCRAVIPAMRRQGSGNIISVSSVLGLRATPERGLYAASKAALNALTDALQVELAGSGIRVTLVCPGRLIAANEPQSWLAMSEADAAERIARCMDHPRRRLTLTLAGRALDLLNRLSPRLADLLLRRVHRRRAARDQRGGGRLNARRRAAADLAPVAAQGERA